MSEFLDYGDPAAMRQRIPELEAEVKGLRDANISIRRDLQTSWEEKNRLREENESLRDIGAEATRQLRQRLTDMRVERNEVERLRERGDWAVEQLRLAEAAGEELREQLSLNRIHDRDCAVREDRLRCIEEAAKRAQAILAPIVIDHPVYERTTAHFDAEGILRAALADQPTEEKA